MNYDVVIVGAGFAGSVLAERIANHSNKKVLLIEKRQHIGGNCFDYFDKNGILIHKYGPHIFHTKNKKVWDYLSQFTDWIEYYHKVLAVVEGKKIPVPFNLNSLKKVFPEPLASALENKLLETFGYGMKIPILKLRETNDTQLRFLADFVYDNIFYGYTIKQWSLRPEELDQSVTARIPVFVSCDDRYFQDNYQAIPSNGYTKIFENLLNSKNINLLLNTNYKEVIKEIKYKTLIYTGAIDEYFDYCFGELPYRSLEFELNENINNFYQETAQVNYPNNHDWTRITEFKHFLPNKTDKSTIAFEYPAQFQIGKNKPYYPIPKDKNQQLYDKYRKRAEELDGSVFFVGRLAEYKYYNMDQVVGVALHLFDNKISKFL